MTLQEKILNCREDQVDDYISIAIAEANKNCERKVSIGFNRSLDFKLTEPHKGFIHRDTKIQPHAFVKPYEVKETNYFYEFARYIRNNNLESEYHLYCSILHFSYKYFFDNRTMKDKQNAESFTKYYKIKD